MNITGLLNNKTGEIIFSRARHDFRWDKTKSIAIDGGFEYTKVSFNTDSDYSVVSFDLDVTKKELYDDWTLGKDKYGSLDSKTINFTIKNVS